MDGKQFTIRTRVLLVILAAALCAFVWVLYDLQITNGGRYLEQSTRKIANTETVQAARGEILDRYGRVLVSNRASYQVTLDTNLMGDKQSRNDTIRTLLEISREQGVSWTDTLPVSAEAPFTYTSEQPYGTADSPSQLRRLIDALKLKDLPETPTAAQLIDALRSCFSVDSSLSDDEARGVVGVLYELTLRSEDVARTSYVFAKDVDISFITAVKERKLSGVKIDTVTVRQYETQYAAHLLGQVGAIYAEDWDRYKDKGYSMNDTVGKDGMELAFEDLLRGTPGTKDIEYNQSGKVVSESWHVNLETGEEESPKPGYNVMTTIDIKLQEVVEEALARYVPNMTSESKKAACVITDMTGGVLALASYPTYDPAEYYTNYTQLSEDPLSPLFNRALQGLYAPGSTFKMVVAAGGLEEGVITPEEEILDTGRYKHYDRVQDQPMCWYYRQYGRTHGYENVSEAIRDSCNVYFYETGLRLGIDKIDQYASQFGLGEKTGLELYEETGEVAGPATSEKHGQTWYEGDTMYAAIGQGNTQLTPIQLANYIATLVNGGTRYSTHLLKTVKSSDFSQVVEEYHPQAIDEIDLNSDNLEAIKQGMKMVATEGSAASYFKDLPVTVGAKTGSAQVTGHEESNAIMVAFAPYENPEIAISVVVEQGGSGSSVAKIVAEILNYYFSAKGTMEAAAGENTLTR